MTRSANRPTTRPWVVSIVALLFSIALAANSLSSLAWDATVFIGFGEEAEATREYGEVRLGDVFLRTDQGHDGKFFFVQANDPWVLEPSENAAIVEPPIYRSQRMLYPLLAGVFGLLGPQAIVWSLLAVNIVGLALGTLATARLATRFGGSAWWGLAFAGNFGLIFDLQNDGAGVVAAALAMWGVLMVYQERFGWAVVFLTGAVLAREVMLVCAAGVSVWHWQEHRRRVAILTVAVPSLVFGAWLLYLRLRLGPDDTSVGAFSAPFDGLARAIPSWLDDQVTLAAGVAVLATLILFSVRWLTSTTTLGWAFIGFAALALVLSERVWREMFDFTRALAPLITAALLLIFVERPRNVHDHLDISPASDHVR